VREARTSHASYQTAGNLAKIKTKNQLIFVILSFNDLTKI
jgi:hypothetical protein